MGKKTIAKNGREVKVHYKGTFDDGTVFDSSYDRGQTIEFTVGSGMMIPGFDAAVNGMRVGETKKVNIAPDDGYGQRHVEAVQTLNRDQFPDDFQFQEGVIIEGVVGDQTLRGIIKGIEDENVIVDFNHPMAGKDLNFEIELVEVI